MGTEGPGSWAGNEREGLHDSPVLVWDPNGSPASGRLVADSSWEDVTVDCSVADELAVHRLNNIQLSAGGPSRPASYGVP